MARDTSDTTPLTTRDELIAWFAAGEKPRERFAIGTEHEKIPFYTADHAPVPYEGERGIRASRSEAAAYSPRREWARPA